MQGSTEGGVNGGANNLGLSYASRVVSSLPLFLGAQVDLTDLMVFGNQASAWFRLAWEHEFEDSRTIQASFISAPGFDFIVAGATVPSDAARMGLGGKIWLTHNLSMLGNFSGAFSPGATATAARRGSRIRGNLRYSAHSCVFRQSLDGCLGQQYVSAIVCGPMSDFRGEHFPKGSAVFGLLLSKGWGTTI